MARRNSSIRDIRTNALDKQSESNKSSKVYTTALINQILEDINKGKKPDLTPFYHGKKELRDNGITFERTEEEEEEYKKCAMDCIYFGSNYVKFRNDKGFTTVKLRDYQEDVLRLMGDEVWDESLNDVTMKNRRIILLQSRQTAKCFLQQCKLTVKNTEKIQNLQYNNERKYNIKNYLWDHIKKFVNTVGKNLKLVI